MKNLLKIITILILILLAGCSEQENIIQHQHSQKDRKAISLKQFQNETKIKDFDFSLKLPVSVAGSSNKITGSLSNFIIDTLAIKKHIASNNKTSYSFRIYPTTELPLTNENYNLVYSKENNVWIQSVFYFEDTKIANQTVYENIEKVYQNTTPTIVATGCGGSSHSYVECDGSCGEAGYDECDGFGCPTGQCVTTVFIIDACSGGGGGSSNPTDTQFFIPNIFENPAFNSSNYINNVKSFYFYSNLQDGEKYWVNEKAQNTATYLSIIQYQIANKWTPESWAFAREILSFEIERDWKTDIKQAISTGITSSAELTHKMYTKLSIIATNHPTSINYLNTVIDGIRNAASTMIDTNPNTCTWTDLFNMWMFELGSNPMNFNGPLVTVTSLQGQQGVSQARNIALNQIQSGNLSTIGNTWTYGQQAF